MRRLLISFVVGASVFSCASKASSMPEQKNLLTHLKREKARAPMGKDWRLLHEMAKTYPKSLAMTVVPSDKSTASLKGESRQEARFGEKRLKAFRKKIQEWVKVVRTKIDHGLYHHGRREFFRNLLPALEKYVVNEVSDAKALLNFHYYIDTLSPPIEEVAAFQDRFLKPKYAAEYKESKIAFYKEYLSWLKKEKEDLSKGMPLSQTDYKELDRKIEHAEARIQHWQDKPVAFEKRSHASYTLDEIMGIERLRALGYTGRGVMVAVMEPPAYYESTEERKLPVHQDLQKRLHENSDAPAALHGSHVSGILVSKARTIFDRVGVAPKATLIYKEAPATQTTDVYYQTAQGLTTQKPKTSKRILVKSIPKAKADDALASAIEGLTKQGVRLLNTSMIYSVGPRTRQALQGFSRQGGVIVKAAGNGGVRFEDPMHLANGELTSDQEYQLGVDMGLFKVVLADPLLAKAYLFVGNMNTATTLDQTSNRAGILAKRFIAAWGTEIASTIRHKDRRKQTGTSMAGPMVLGGLALLSEAYPRCNPQVLAQNLLDASVKLLPQEDFGQGRLDVAAAFEMSARTCGLPQAPVDS
jgi:hypothetical protein